MKEQLNLSNSTIEQLRKSGIKCRVTHKRIIFAPIENGKLKESLLSKFEILQMKKARLPYTVMPRGGTCIVEVDYNGGKYFGIAKCSKDDNYCYRRGVKISLGRLEKQ